VRVCAFAENLTLALSAATRTMPLDEHAPMTTLETAEALQILMDGLVLALVLAAWCCSPWRPPPLLPAQRLQLEADADHRS
jgi:hypothetical protein